MVGTLVNAAAVAVGATVGLGLHRRLSSQASATALQGVGLITLYLGFEMAFSAMAQGPARVSVLATLVSVAIGGFLGEYWAIEARLEQLGRRAEQRLARGGDSSFTRSFVSSSLLFVVGPMTIVGSLNDGMAGDYRLLLTKSLMDGISSVAFGATMGPGVLLSVVTVLVVQGALTGLGALMGRLVDPALIAAVTAAGGLLIIGIGLNLVQAARIRVANLLPALAVAVLMGWLWPRLGIPF